MSRESHTPETIFAEAIAIAEAEGRAAFLDRACAHDSVLRSEVERLVEDHFRAGDFLEQPAGRIGTAASQSASEQLGSQIGPYSLLQQIGEGGMGVVYMAEQTEPVERRVALKIVKPGMDSRQVIARFEVERQILALMDHPNIAKVLDAGTAEQGWPYFVMELVKGVPITKYCDAHRFTPRQRLELFVPVCQAVQHAHQKGIIHRDIKPSNVLVAEYDEKPVAKIIDFGVAKAIGQRLTDKSMFTRFGQVVGTLEYMSPEQAKLNQLDIDTRTDVYSLGVLLYELLTGETPFDQKRLHDAAFDEMLRIIREEEPPRPSTRLSSSGSLPSLAANRQLEPGRLVTLVRRELDWIVMMALEKDRSRRYETANGLAMDIQRYLADEPVLACPPSAIYRFRKFARRNQVALLTTAIVAVALVTGAVVSTWQAIRAARAERVAQDERAVAEANFQNARAAVDEYFTIVSENKLLDVPGLQPLRKDLLEAALRFYQGFAAERTSDPRVLADLAVAHLRVSVILNTLFRADEAVVSRKAALDLVDRLRRDYPDAVEQHCRLAGFWRGWRRVQSTGVRPRDEQGSRRTLERMAATWQQLADANPSVIGFQSDLAAVYGHLGDLLWWQAEPAVEYLGRAQFILERLVRDYPAVAEYRADLAEILDKSANPQSRFGRQDKADSARRRCLELREKLVAEFPDVPQYRIDLSESLAKLGRSLSASQPREAEQAYRRAIELAKPLAEQSPTTRLYQERLIVAWVGLAPLLIAAGKDEEANVVLQQVVATGEKLVVDYPVKMTHMGELGDAYRMIADQLRASDPAGAEVNYDKAVEVYEHKIADDPKNQYAPLRLADFLRARGDDYLTTKNRPDKAEALYRRAIELNPRLFSASFSLADALRRQNKLSEAIEIHERLVKLNPETAADCNKLAWLLATCPTIELRAPARALELARRAIELDPDVAATANTLGVAHYRARNWQDAIEWLDKSMNARHGGDGFDRFFLAMSYWQVGDKQQARKWYDQAVEWMEKNGNGNDQLRRVHTEAAGLVRRDEGPMPPMEIKP